MVTSLHNTGGEVDKAHILVGGCMAEKNPGEVIVVKFPSTVSWLFDAYPHTKQFEAEVTLEWGFPRLIVDKSVVEENRVA